MSKEKLRTDKTCLNCSFVVDQRYCPNCGQENTKSTKSFHHLFIHFFEDLTHYDNAFWKTIFNLFFKPAALTKAYHSGKRLSFLAPVRLYLFISFITFLSISLFPNETGNKSGYKPKKNQIMVPSIDSLHIEEKGVDGLTKFGIISQENNDVFKKLFFQSKKVDTNFKVKKAVNIFEFKTINQLDSIQENSSQRNKVTKSEYWFFKKWLKVKNENTNEQIIDKFTESFTHNLSKVLFLYMPVFAFILWLFHDKKKWYYFDNGIFTLHYFSFLLLVILSLFFIDKIFPLIGMDPALIWMHILLKIAGTIWMLYYFFPAHRRFYGEKFMISSVKSASILILNLVIIALLMAVYALYTYMNIH